MFYCHGLWIQSEITTFLSCVYLSCFIFVVFVTHPLSTFYSCWQELSDFWGFAVRMDMNSFSVSVLQIVRETSTQRWRWVGRAVYFYWSWSIMHGAKTKQLIKWPITGPVSASTSKFWLLNECGSQWFDVHLELHARAHSQTLSKAIWLPAECWL